jgi:hypothetical protein
MQDHTLELLCNFITPTFAFQIATAMSFVPIAQLVLIDLAV